MSAQKERITLGAEIAAAEVPEGQPLRRRNRNNPKGFWTVLGSMAERKPNQDDVAVLVDGVWRFVVFPLGGWRGGGRPQGSTDKTPRKSRKKEKFEKG